jgi:hypothetical protein
MNNKKFLKECIEEIEQYPYEVREDENYYPKSSIIKMLRSIK